MFQHRPLGTCRNVNKSQGSLLPTTLPISDANVSPQLQAMAPRTATESHEALYRC